MIDIIKNYAPWFVLMIVVVTCSSAHKASSIENEQTILLIINK